MRSWALLLRVSILAGRSKVSALDGVLAIVEDGNGGNRTDGTGAIPGKAPKQGS